jgi:hypothetical protein
VTGTAVCPRRFLAPFFRTALGRTYAVPAKALILRGVDNGSWSIQSVPTARDPVCDDDCAAFCKEAMQGCAISAAAETRSRLYSKFQAVVLLARELPRLSKAMGSWDEKRRRRRRGVQVIIHRNNAGSIHPILWIATTSSCGVPKRTKTMRLMGGKERHLIRSIPLACRIY